MTAHDNLESRSPGMKRTQENRDQRERRTIIDNKKGNEKHRSGRTPNQSRNKLEKALREVERPASSSGNSSKALYTGQLDDREEERQTRERDRSELKVGHFSNHVVG